MVARRGVAGFWGRPEILFWAFVGLHAALWTLLPALLYPNPPLDIIEALVMGREWQLGYAKLPPLPWWTVEAVRGVAGDRIWPIYLTAQVFDAVPFWAVWRLGHGIPSELLGRIFDPFVTSKLGRGGSGLGLHIVWNTVTAVLGGSITVASAPGEGTRFHIILPLVAPRQSPAA